LGAVDPGRPEAAVLGDLDRGEESETGGGEPVDIVLGEPGVGESAARGLEVELVGRPGVDPSAV
jgi:hypothetical protein